MTEKKNPLLQPWQANLRKIDKVRPAQEISDYSDNLSFPVWDKEEATSQDGFNIQFVHIPTNEFVSFKAFITNYEDNYESQWNEEEVFGRMDPISTFQRTRRRISLGWVVPSFSEDEALLNLDNADRFLSMLYPVYESFDPNVFGEFAALDQHGGKREVSTMVAPPLFKMKFANLAMDSEVGTVNSSVRNSGLVGTISGLSYRPDIEQGFFSSGFSDQIVPGALVPQTINFDLEFTVHHQHGLGFRSRTKKEQKNRFSSTDPRASENFPHGIDKILK